MVTSLRLIAASTIAVAPAVYAGSFFSQLVEGPPTASATVPVSYQTAHRNIARGLRICAPYDPIVTGTIYQEAGFADLFTFQRGTGNPLLSYIEIRAIDDRTSQVQAWHPKPTFGEGMVQFARAAPALAVMGGTSSCKDLGF